jgi:uncharacterized protein (TIGR03435 family)
MTRLASVATLVVTVGLASQPAAQSASGAAFEVVSIKPTNPDVPGPSMPPVGGRFTASGASLRSLVQLAYELPDFRIDGGPEWQASRRFDIQAKASEPLVGLDAMRPMLKALLADRFHLKVHTEVRDLPIYALVVMRKDGQLAATVTPSSADCSTAAQDLARDTATDPGTVGVRLQAGQGLPCAIMPIPSRTPGSMTMRANAASMGDLARMLTPATGRVVEDRTGLSGRYDWEITFDRALRPRATPPSGSNQAAATLPPDSPSVTTALQELGLKLEPTHGSVEILVIDSAALPTAD